MKKHLFLLFATLFMGLAAEGVAQVPFAVSKIPFVKFVKVTSNDVNLRKLPNVKSPRLVYAENEIGDYESVWQMGALKPGQEVAHANVLPVVAEVGDWVKALFENNTVYVKKQFCREVATRRLPIGGSFEVIRTGKYKDCCFNMQETYGGFELQIGRYVNGMYVFEYQAWCDAYSENGTVIGANSDNYISFDKKYANEFDQPDAKKIFADAVLVDKIMKNLGKMQKQTVIYYGVEGDEDMYSVTLP